MTLTSYFGFNLLGSRVVVFFVQTLNLSCVFKFVHYFSYLNNEKLPFMLALSSINQIYFISIKKIIYSVPKKNPQTFSLLLNTAHLFVCNKQCHSSMFKGYSQKGIFIHSPWSIPIIQMDTKQEDFSLKTQ